LSTKRRKGGIFKRRLLLNGATTFSIVPISRMTLSIAIKLESQYYET
jgi:hypothetical protein